MCSPLVAKMVQARIHKEGRPAVRPPGTGLSRRDMLKAGSLAALTAALAAPALRPGRVQAQGGMLVVDLTQPLTDTTPTFPAFNPPTRETLYTVADNGFYVQSWAFAEHSATHMDAPGHFIADGALVDALEPANFMAPLVVIDIAAKAESDPDAQVTPEDIMAYESAYGEIPAGAFVAMHSGWETKYSDVAAFRGTDAEGGLHFPGFHPDAATMLVTERDIVGAGVDTLSLDYGPSADFGAHYAFLGAGKYGIENLKGLQPLVGQAATVFIGIPLYQQGSGGPCRVLALLPQA
ncbi:MAG: cyclase family protein [Anaerolineae bacterium]|nr:cyclase family protein [Anaerolineae bacterium]